MKKSVVTLGVFDGVHRGHKHIFRKVMQRALIIGGTPAVYTFDPHPARVLAPDTCPPMINTLSQKIDLIRASGIRRIVVQKFTPSFSHRTPEDFFKKTIVQSLQAKEIFVGYDFTFGRHRSGTIERLERLAREAEIRVTIVEAFFRKEMLVSSTQIRRLLALGNLPKAEELLGRPYFIDGKVIHGRGIGGRDLGIHTANLRSENDPILPTGVYVSMTSVGGKRYRSVTNIGPNPTFGPGPLSIETHLLNFRKQIFGKNIRVEFLAKIREEITFASAQDLAAQIRNDILTAKRHFGKMRK